MKIKTIVRGDNHGFRLAKRFDGLRITQTGEIANDAGKAGTRGAPLTNGGSGGGRRRCIGHAWRRSVDE